jgi:hypothetical protein
MLALSRIAIRPIRVPVLKNSQILRKSDRQRDSGTQTALSPV